MLLFLKPNYWKSISSYTFHAVSKMKPKFSKEHQHTKDIFHFCKIILKEKQLSEKIQKQE